MLTLRTDAAQNRADILDAADRIFAEHGVTAPLEMICKAADVGRATLYRNFPDRHALLLALLQRSLDQTQAMAEKLGDAPDAFFDLLRFQAERITQRSALVDYWRVLDRETPSISVARARFHDLFRPLLVRAKAARLCREDLSVEDVPLLTAMLGAALRGRDAAEKSTLGLKALGLVTEGLRPRGEA